MHIHLLILFSFLFGFRQINQPSTSTTIEWLTPMEHDFGDLPQGEAITYYFKYKNLSDQALVIDNVRPSCGCTAPDWSLVPINTGETGKLKIVFDAKKEGYFRKKIKVYFNQLRKAEVLYIEGYVE